MSFIRRWRVAVDRQPFTCAAAPATDHTAPAVARTIYLYFQIQYTCGRVVRTFLRLFHWLWVQQYIGPALSHYRRRKLRRRVMCTACVHQRQIIVLLYLVSNVFTYRPLCITILFIYLFINLFLSLYLFRHQCIYIIYINMCILINYLSGFFLLLREWHKNT